MNNSLSKPVLAMLAAGSTLIVALLWFGPRPPARPQPEPAAGIKTENAAPSAPARVAEPNDDELPPVVPIPLTNVLLEAENGSWRRDQDYLQAPHQPQEFGGVAFLMDGLIQLQGRTSKEWKNRSYRRAVIVPLALTNFSDGGIEIIQRGSNVASLHLLGATRYGSNAEKTFAEIVWRYTDGTALRTPVQYLTHFRDWVRNPYEEPAHLPYAFSKVVWTVPQPAQSGHALRLYRTSFANPAPKKIIRQLEFVSAMEDPTWFIVGVTLDPLKLGQRPDFTTDLEPSDPVPPEKIEVTVQSAGGQRLPQSKLQIQFNQRDGQKTFRTSGLLTTDASGSAHVSYPPQNLDQLSISASHDDYGGRKMLWDLKAGDTVPASYTIKLGTGVNIGGVIVDESDAPIAGAKVSLYRFWSGSDDSPDRKGEQADFAAQTVTTDTRGNWRAQGLPAEMLDHIGFDVKHPEFPGTNLTVGANGDVKKQLRAGTLKIVLQPGLDARGLVTDDQDRPISGATVWAGLRNYRDRQQAETDRNGRFGFHNVTAGEVVFSVSAKGRAPDSKPLLVKKDMAEIVFKLSAGKTIRAVVQDESASPISGVRVVLEGNGDIGRTYEFSATTDGDGRFEWDGAPDAPGQFYFGKAGYESKRDFKLAPDQDNLVTLRRPRQLQGLVLDATTEQPVVKFTVRTGTASGDNSDVYGVVRYKDFTAADGRFSMSLEEEADNAAAVYADGYTDMIDKFPEAQNGIVQVTARLQPAATLSGVVLAPDGTPAPGVNVAAASGDNHIFIQLAGGRLRSFGSSKISTTDPEGRFKISSAPEDGMIVAAGEPGFARAPLAEVRSSKTIMLQAWGRIEGTLKIGGQPGARKDLLFNLAIPGIGTDFNGYKATTDEQGKFSMEKIPPGEGAIVRLIQTSPNSWSHSDSTSVTVKPGETTPVTLGDNGAVIAGRIRFDNPPTNDVALNFEGSLSGQLPQQPAFNSPEAAQAFYRSPEWQALMKLHKNYSIEMRPDGSFTVDDVAPGEYLLNISVHRGGERSWEHPPMAQGWTHVTVPDSFNPATPIDVGEILLKPNQQP